MEKKVNEPRDERLVITKIDAARRQLQTAIELFVADRDPISVHTLSMAANEILTTLCEKNGKSTFLKGSIMELAIDEVKANELLREIVKPRNYFKHANRDAENTIKFAASMNDAILFDSVNSYRVLTGGMPVPFHAYKIWYILNYRQFFNISEESGLTDFAEIFAVLPTDQFFRQVCKIISESDLKT